MDQIEDLAEPMERGEPVTAFTAAEEVREDVQKAETDSEPEPVAEMPEGWTGPNHDTKKRYSPEFKKMIVRLHCEEGQSVKNITNQYGVSKATITKWCSDARYENMARANNSEKELQAVREENARVKDENIFLKRILVMLFGKEMEGLA
ncbi:MAG: transposase [Clostridiales bacterium]|nr:transposase [Clostridiales bacterium]